MLLKGGLGLRGSAPDASRICVFSVIKASALADAFYVLDSKILNLHQRAVFLCFSCYCEKQVNYVSQFADLNIFFQMLRDETEASGFKIYGSIFDI